MADNNFKTTDLYLATYLDCLGYTVSLEHISNNKVMFIMPEKASRKEDVAGYFDRTAKVSPRVYAETLKTLKSMIANSK